MTAQVLRHIDILCLEIRCQKDIQTETSCVGKTWSHLAATTSGKQPQTSDSHNESLETNKDQEKGNWSLIRRGSE